MSEERRMILQMLQEGAITVEEAERLIEAAAPDEERLSAVSGRLTPKRIVVVVTENGRTVVNVRIPFSLVRVGLKLGQSFGAIGAGYVKDDEQAAVALETLRSIDIDEVLDSISDGDITLPYTMVDMDEVDKGQSVRVVLE